jgi:NCAIR mutase (PurE)-related protein
LGEPIGYFTVGSRGYHLDPLFLEEVATIDEGTLRRLLEACAGGELSVDDAVRELRYLPYSDLGFARVDHHRELRLGLPEAVYGPGKTAEQAAAIVAALLERNVGAVIVTRATKSQFEAVAAIAPEAVFHEVAGLIVARAQQASGGRPVAVAAAGTADLRVAEEAAVTAEALGLPVERLHDVGVAGLHRLLDARAVLDGAGVVIVVAGMDGALASVVGGLVAAPVVAVPTSVGYGAGAGGIAPLLTMLNSCAPGVVAVNIDNGFGAAVFAAMVLRPRTQ